MKKLLSLLTLLVVAISASAASYIPTTVNAISANTLILPKDLTGSETWVNIPSKTLTDKGLNPSAWDTDFGATQPSGNVKCLQVKKDGGVYNSSKRVIHMLVSGITGVKAIGQANSGRGFQIGATEYVSGTTTESTAMTVVAGSTEALNPVSYSGLDASKTYIVSIFAYDSDTYLYGVYFTAAPQVPTITTQPESAAYATGDPIAALTVEATASAGTLTYQWYSCDDAEKTNASAINGATSASYTPSAAGFYFVNVKDANGNIDSDVAQITISAAEAPTINVSGAPADDVVVGTEVILTAETTGTPTPTVTWYDGDTDEEITTGATYTVPTDVAGTFSIYAVASNGVEPDATSSVQTIVVKEQVATPTFTPNGAYFEESQSVVIESATEDAVIEYSTDGGESWTAYTEALNITETTTIIAKATKQDYLNSETATATFTKVTLDPQVDVTAAASWDWSKFGTATIQLTDATTPSKTTEFVLSNIVNYGKCSAISADFGDAQQLKVTTEYVVRDSKYIQGGSIKFNTTVPGTVTVKYTNTGNRSSEDDRRFLNVNGTNYGEGTMSSKEADAVTTSVNVAAGEVAIKGTLKKDGSDQYLRIYTITFTPATTEAITIPSDGVLTYVTQNPVDFSTQNGAFKAYVVTATSTTSATTAEVTAVPAGTPLLIKGAAGNYEVEVVASAEAPEANLLQVATADPAVIGGDNIYAYSKSAKKFKKVAATVTIPAGKCYLEIEGEGPDALDIIFDGEATAIGNVNANDNANFAPVKVLTAKGIQIGKFNVAGQQVK